MSITAADNSPSRPRPACAIWGASPRINRSFCRVCSRADAKYAAERQHETGAVQRARRLLDNSVSPERAWAELNDPRNRPTPQVTIEAIMYCVRERGVAALVDPGNNERLKTCDAAAKRRIRERIVRLTRGRGEP
jgi:hypothetical protein